MANLFRILFFISVVSYFINPAKAQVANDVAKDFLSRSEQADVAEYLDSICADTFCGGDYDFSNIGVFCQEDCVLYYDISPNSRMDIFPIDEFFAAPQEYRVKNTSEVYLKLYKPRMFDDYDLGINGEMLRFRNIKLTGRCILKNIPESSEQLSFEDKKEIIYNSQLSCIAEITESMTQLRFFFETIQ